MRKVPLTPRAAGTLETQLEAFEKRFGRKPLPGESVFFDSSSLDTTPQPVDPAKVMAQLVEALRASGADEALIYAIEKTGRVLTSTTYASVPKHIREEWDAAVAEYRKQNKR